MGVWGKPCWDLKNSAPALLCPMGGAIAGRGHNRGHNGVAITGAGP